MVIFNKQTKKTISSITNGTCSIQSFILHCTPRNLSFLSHHLAYGSYTLVIMALVWKSSNNKGSRLYYLLEAVHEWGMVMAFWSSVFFGSRVLNFCSPTSEVVSLNCRKTMNNPTNHNLDTSNLGTNASTNWSREACTHIVGLVTWQTQSGWLRIDWHSQQLPIIQSRA